MNEKGYLVSKNLINKIKKADRSLQTTTQGIDRYNGKNTHSRVFAQIVEKTGGSPSGCTYSANQVVMDASGYWTVVTGGLTWGSTTADVGELIDVNSTNIIEYAEIDIDKIRIKPNTVVEAWYLGNESGDVIWYCDANYNNYGVESGYELDSGMQYDSAHPESAIVDSGWPNDQPYSGFIVTIQTGTVYNYAGDKILYAYLRDFTYDGLGRLISVSVERRQVIDTPESC